MTETFFSKFLKYKISNVIFLLFLFGSPHPGESTGSLREVLILLDQSASINGLINQKSGTQQVEILLTRLEYPYKITLVGFSDVMGSSVAFIIKTEGDVKAFIRRVRRRQFNGITTDFEIPFRYLLEKKADNKNVLALIISDGEPEIWDEKRWFLSKRIRRDSRYEELNKKYRFLKTKEGSFKVIYHKLFSLYQIKNFSFIEKQLPLLRKEFGERLFFVDISEGSGFFKEWSKQAGAQYIGGPFNLSSFTKRDIPPLPGAALPTIVLLLDRSGSMRHFMNLRATKKRLSNALKRLEYPFQIILAGFTDAMQIPANYVLNNDRDLSSLINELAQIKYKGVTTDFEMPFRFLLENTSGKDFRLALIISDGEPEIWDEKRWFLSTRIRRDKRYDDLNRQYVALKKEKVSFRNIYEKLLSAYTSKNMFLIEEKLPLLEKKLSNQLVFFDVSSESPFFVEWAERAGGEYIPVIAQELQRELPALVKTKKTVPMQVTLEYFDIPEPAYKSEKSPEKEDPAKELPPKKDSPKEVPFALVEKFSLASQKSPSKKEMILTSIKETKEVVLIFFLGLFVLVFLYWRLKRTNAPALARTVLPQGTPKSRGVERQKKVEQDSDFKDIHERILKITQDSEIGLQRLIDKEVAYSSVETDTLRTTLLKEEEGKIQFHGSLSFAHPIPPGTITVTLKKDAVAMRRSVLSTSTRTITLEGVNLRKAKVKSVFFHQNSLTLQVKESRFLTEEENSTTFLLDQFVDNIDDRMRWLELISRTGD